MGTKSNNNNNNNNNNNETPAKSAGSNEAAAAASAAPAFTNNNNNNTKMRKTDDPRSRKKLRIDTSAITTGRTSVTKNLASGGALTPTSSAQDTHPFARGSVIEVWHIQKKAAGGDNNDDDDDDWWSEPDSSSDEEEGGEKRQRTIRLCDIIDRTPLNSGAGTGTGTASGSTKNSAAAAAAAGAAGTQQPPQQQQWRYYVHYRDFNRRMDEWINMDRIVSPPSVGNAKARALKKEEERQKRKQERLKLQQQEKEQAILAAAAIKKEDGTTTTSTRRRRSTAAQMLMTDDSDQTGTASTRRRRLSRRKTTSFIDDDAATVNASNVSGSGDDLMGGDNNDMDDFLNASAHNSVPAGVGGNKAGGVGSIAGGNKSSSQNNTNNNNKVINNSSNNKKDVFIAPELTTHTVGEHVVATVQAVELDEHEGLDEASLREHEEVTKIKNVGFLELGCHQMETWYYSPLPKELTGSSGFLEVLYVCEFTFRMFARKSELQRFQSTRLPPDRRHPPGNEIYRNGSLSMFEVDGLEEKIYCQNLCYIAKLFLDHKTLYFDVDPFLFYVLCEVDDRGFHPVGYFSKEKYSDVGYNLACILSFPAHQRKGYGRFLIAFSYELTKKEEKVGSPEKPMSDLGQQAYKPYWASTIIDFLLYKSDESALSIMDIAKKTSIMAEDIVFTLNQLGILKIINGVYFVAAERSLLQRLAKKYPVKEPRVDPSKLHWTPFLTDIKRDKFSIYSKKASADIEEANARLVQQTLAGNVNLVGA